MQNRYEIVNYNAINDYGLIYTAIVNPSKRKLNIRYLFKRWKITNLHDSLIDQVMEEICDICEILSQKKTYKYGNYYFFAKILEEIEDLLQERIIFLETRRILEEPC